MLKISNWLCGNNFFSGGGVAIINLDGPACNSSNIYCWAHLKAKTLYNNGTFYLIKSCLNYGINCNKKTKTVEIEENPKLFWKFSNCIYKIRTKY